MSKLAKALTAAAGNAAGESLYAEDVFSTYLYEGNGTATTITNNVDLDGEGGLVWLKDRSQAQSNYLFDTENGANKFLISDLTAAISTVTNRGVTAFNSNGFDLGSSSGGNRSGDDYASWTFRKAEKFFDVVTYTGTGSGIKVIDHNLGSAPAVIFVKKTNSSQDWLVFSKDTSQPHNKYLKLNTTDAELNYDNIWGENGYLPTDTQFKVQHLANESSSTYVAYLFASDAGGFGDDGSESIIKCGEFSVDGSYEADVECGFEPQWVLIKPAEDSASWLLFDTMRGAPVGGDTAWLAPNLSQQEAFTANRFNPTATGFHIGNYGITAGNKIIYIAIRRPMKTPESGTEVYQTDTRGGTSPTPPAYTAGFPVDLGIMRFSVAGTSDWRWANRLTGTKFLESNTSDAEGNDGGFLFDYMDGWSSDTGTNSAYRSWMFKRATGFFDVVAYTGDGVAGSTQAHNLGVVPECMIVKRRDGASSWITYWDALGATKGQFLDTNQAFTSSSYWNDTAPTATQLTLGSGSTNNSGATFIAYLFATLDGVSKVGSYTGNGTSLNIDCGFSNGARFILIKSSSNEGHWMVFDSERGIVAGNDPQLQLNTTNSESNADWIDPYSAGFTVNNASTNNYFGPNRSGFDYIFLAIA